jgi:hypothetical protein
MDQSDAHAALKQDSELTNQTQVILRQDIRWTNQRHMQYWDRTQNEHTRTTGIIGTRISMITPE